MSIIAAGFRMRWRRPMRGDRHYEQGPGSAGSDVFPRRRYGRSRCAAYPASGHCGGGGDGGVGAPGPDQRYPALCPSRSGRGGADARGRLADLVGLAADHATSHGRRVCGCRDRRHCAGAVVQSIEVAGIFAVPLCGDPAGHPRDRDRAVAPDLSAAADRRHCLRLDRRIFPGAVEHHARSEFGGPQPGRPVPALRRRAARDACPAQISVSTALYPRRPAHRGRPVLDRRGGCRNRCRQRGRGFRAGLSNCGIRLPSQHSPHVRGAVVALARRDCHLCPAGANLAFTVTALARERSRKAKLMAGGAISSEKIDLVVHGPRKPIVDNGFSDQFVLHHFETTHDLERLTPEVAARARGMAVTYNSVRGDARTLARFPKLEIVAAFGVGYDHVDAAYARDHDIMVTNTPDVLTEEVADVAMGLLICTLREFVKADRYLRMGLWKMQNLPLSVGSLRDRKVGMVGMGRIGQAIARRLEASRVPVVYHTRNPAAGVSYQR